MRRVTAAASAALLLLGAGAWARVTFLTPQVLADQQPMYDDPRYSAAIDPGDGEIAMRMFDAQLATLVLVACGVALLAVHLTRPWSAGATVASVGVCLVPVSGLLTRLLAPSAGWSLAGAAALLAVAGVVGMATTPALGRLQRWRALLAEGDDLGGAGRRTVLVWCALMAVGSATMLAASSPDTWVDARVSGLVVVDWVEALLLAAAVALCVAATSAPRPATVAVSSAALAVGGWLSLGHPPQTPAHQGWAWIVVGGVLATSVSTAVITGSRTGEQPLGVLAHTRLVLLCAIGWVLGLGAGVTFGLAAGMAALAVAGGELGADGVPTLLIGVVAAQVVVVAHLLVRRRVEDWRPRPGPRPRTGRALVDDTGVPAGSLEP